MLMSLAFSFLSMQVEYLDDASLTGFVAEDVVQVGIVSSDFWSASTLPPLALFSAHLIGGMHV
jgi:hypothetical protein